MTFRLTLLRHGRSRADDEHVHEGRYDSPLMAVGHAQARALAAYWQAHPPGFDRVYASPLVRAHETASLVARALDLPVTPTPLLMEWDNGPLAGLSHEEAMERYPVPRFRHGLSPLTPEGGESQAAIRARALLALEHIWQGGGAHALVVSHGGFLNSLLRELTGAHRAWFRFGDTAFATAELSQTSHTALVTGVNLTPHLPASGKAP